MDGDRVCQKEICVGSPLQLGGIQAKFYLQVFIEFGEEDRGGLVHDNSRSSPRRRAACVRTVRMSFDASSDHSDAVTRAGNRVTCSWKANRTYKVDRPNSDRAARMLSRRFSIKTRTGRPPSFSRRRAQ